MWILVISMIFINIIIYKIGLLNFSIPNLLRSINLLPRLMSIPSFALHCYFSALVKCHLCGSGEGRWVHKDLKYIQIYRDNFLKSGGFPWQLHHWLNYFQKCSNYQKKYNEMFLNENQESIGIFKNIQKKKTWNLQI
jgi:hypothetical protein